jgi:zinc protease
VLPLVNLNIAVKAGAVSYPVGQAGLTNFVGEMLLRGTTSKTKEQVDLALDQMGARLEVETRSEFMVMRGSVLASQLEPFLRLVSELITKPVFSETEIRKLKDLVASAIREEMGRDASLASRKFTRFLFRGHPYGKPVLGREKEVFALTRAKLIEHYDRIFRDSHFVVVGTGDTDPEVIQNWTKTIVAARPDLQPSAGDSGALSAPVNPDARRLLIVDKPDRTQNQIHIGQIGVKLTDPDYFAIYLGNYAFGGPSFMTRLMREVRVKRGWSYGAGSHFMHGTQPRLWQVHLFPAAKDAADALTLAIKLVEELALDGITQEEFDFSRTSLINGDGFRYDTPAKRVENRLLEIVLDLPAGFMKSYRPEIEKLTLARVNAALRKFLQPDKLSISVLGSVQPSPEAREKGAPIDLVDRLTTAAAVSTKMVEIVSYKED